MVVGAVGAGGDEGGVNGTDGHEEEVARGMVEGMAI